MKYLKRIGMLALLETHWTGHAVTKIRSTTIIHSGSSSSRIHGVAIALSPRACAAWEAAGIVFNPVSERILSIRVRIHMSYATIIAVYAPTNPLNSSCSANEPSDTFYDLLQATLSAAPQRDMIIILGDFNARVGADSHQGKTIIGPHGLGEQNGNGKRLFDFCTANQLLVTNIWFQHKPLHQATWYRNGNRSHPGHMIDYVLVNNHFRSSVLDTSMFRSTYLDV